MQLEKNVVLTLESQYPFNESENGSTPYYPPTNYRVYLPFNLLREIEITEERFRQTFKMHQTELFDVVLSSWLLERGLVRKIWKCEQIQPKDYRYLLTFQGRYPLFWCAVSQSKNGKNIKDLYKEIQLFLK